MNRPSRKSGDRWAPSEPDALWLTEQLRASRLTVLCGETGSAMTGLLRHGVLPRLRRRAQDPGAPGTPAQRRLSGVLPFPDRRRPARHRVDAEVSVFFDQWSVSPREGLLACLQQALPEAGVRDGKLPSSLAERLATLSRRCGVRFMFVFDRFEECLAAPPHREDLRALRDEIFRAVNQPGLPAQFLIALREDEEPLLEQLRGRINGFDATRRPFAPGRATVHGPWTLAHALPPPSAAARALAAQTDEVYASIETLLARMAQSNATQAGEQEPARADAAGEPGNSTPTEAFAAEPSPAAVRLPTFDPPPPMARPPEPPSATHESGDEPPAPVPAPVERYRPFAASSSVAASVGLDREPIAPAPLFRLGLQSRRASAVGAVLPLLMVGVVGTGLWFLPRPDAPVEPAVALAETRAAPAGAERAPPGDGPLRFAAPAAGIPAPAAGIPAPAAGIPATAAVEAGPRIALNTPDPTAERMAGELARAARRAGGPRFEVLPSRGWAEDLAGLRGASGLAIARYDALLAARDQGSTGPLQIVMPLFTEELAFVVRADSPLQFIHEIEGRPINTGAPQGARALTVRTAYERLFGRSLTAGQAGIEGETAALQALVQGPQAQGPQARGPQASTDVVVLVGSTPAQWLAGSAAEWAGRLRLLKLDRDHPASRRALRSLLPARLSLGADGLPAAQPTPTLAVMSFLVAGGAGAMDDTTELGRVARLLCQQLPDLQRDGHPKWREVLPELQLDAGWPYAPEAQRAVRDCTATRNDNTTRGGDSTASPPRPAPKTTPVPQPLKPGATT